MIPCGEGTCELIIAWPVATFLTMIILSTSGARAELSLMMEVYEVAVVGAGVEGSATAYYLASRGTRPVLLLEQVRELQDR